MSIVTFYCTDPRNAPKTTQGAHLGGNAILLWQDRLLLERRVDADVWGLIGGGAKKWETGRQAVARECLEELGITVNPADMEFVHLCHRVAGGDGRTYYDLCFVIRKYDGTPAVMEPNKNAGLRWFPTEALPENTSTAVEVMLRPCLRGQPYSEVIHDLPVTSI